VQAKIGVNTLVLGMTHCLAKRELLPSDFRYSSRDQVWKDEEGTALTDYRVLLRVTNVRQTGDHLSLSSDLKLGVEAPRAEKHAGVESPRAEKNARCASAEDDTRGNCVEKKRVKDVIAIEPYNRSKRNFVASSSIQAEDKNKLNGSVGKSAGENGVPDRNLQSQRCDEKRVKRSSADLKLRCSEIETESFRAEKRAKHATAESEMETHVVDKRRSKEPIAIEPYDRSKHSSTVKCGQGQHVTLAASSSKVKNQRIK